MRLICGCGFVRDIAPIGTAEQSPAQFPFTCATCVAASEARRQAAVKVAKENIRQEKVVARREQKTPVQKLALVRKRKQRFKSRVEMLAYIKAGLAEKK